MASLSPNKSTKGASYKIQYTIPGEKKIIQMPDGTTKTVYPRHTRRLPKGTTLQEANLILAEYNRALARHKNKVEPFKDPMSRSSKIFSIRNLQNWFIENYKTGKRTGKELHPNTIDLYNRSFKKLLDAIGNVSIELTLKQRTQFQEYLQHFSATSRSIFIRSIRSAWNFAIQEDIANSNPFLKIPVTKEKREPLIFTKSEIVAIYKKIEHPEMKVAFAMAWLAGRRPVEICQNIIWPWLNFETGWGIIKKAKTKYNQYFVLRDDLIEILLEFRKDDGYICSLSRSTLADKFAEARKDAGIKKDGCAFRTLRHTWITAIVQELGLAFGQKAAGHDDINVTMLYTHIGDPVFRERINKIEL